jgi:Uma2 family endonuclease
MERTVMSIQTQIRLSLVDFMQQYDEAPFELIDGTSIPLAPSTAEHEEITQGVYRLLLSHEVHAAISVYAALPFVLTDNANRVTDTCVPDLMVYGAARIQGYKMANPDWRQKPLVLVPDLCLEIISPDDHYIDVAEKVDLYLSKGVKLVWLLNPHNRSVTVHTIADDGCLRLSGDNLLTGGDVMPDFTLRVSDIFANLQP